MEKILKTVSEQTGIPVEDILSRKRDGRTSEARGIFIYCANAYGNSNTGIAAFIGQTQSNISMQIKKINFHLRRYKSLNDKTTSILIFMNKKDE